MEGLLFTDPTQILLISVELRSRDFPVKIAPTLTVTFHFFCQKEVDAEQELIRLCSTEPTEVKDLPMRIPKESARYHFFLYKHSHEGDYLESTGE